MSQQSQSSFAVVLGHLRSPGDCACEHCERAAIVQDSGRSRGQSEVIAAEQAARRASREP